MVFEMAVIGTTTRLPSYPNPVAITEPSSATMVLRCGSCGAVKSSGMSWKWSEAAFAVSPTVPTTGSASPAMSTPASALTRTKDARLVTTRSATTAGCAPRPECLFPAPAMRTGYAGLRVGKQAGAENAAFVAQLLQR